MEGLDDMKKVNIIITMIAAISVIGNIVLGIKYSNLQKVNYIVEKTATENTTKNANRKNIDDIDRVEATTISNYCYIPAEDDNRIVEVVTRFTKLYYNYTNATFIDRLKDVSPLMTEECYAALIDGMDLESQMYFPYDIESNIESINVIISDYAKDENATCYAAAYISGKVNNESTKTGVLMEYILSYEEGNWKISEIHTIGSNELE